MHEMIDVLQTMNQDQAIVALFAGILILSVVTVAVATVLRALGKWGAMAAVLAIAAIAVTRQLAR